MRVARGVLEPDRGGAVRSISRDFRLERGLLVALVAVQTMSSLLELATCGSGTSLQTVLEHKPRGHWTLPSSRALTNSLLQTLSRLAEYKLIS